MYGLYRQQTGWSCRCWLLPLLIWSKTNPVPDMLVVRLPVCTLPAGARMYSTLGNSQQNGDSASRWLLLRVRRTTLTATGITKSRSRCTGGAPCCCCCTCCCWSLSVCDVSCRCGSAGQLTGPATAIHDRTDCCSHHTNSCCPHQTCRKHTVHRLAGW